MTWPRLAIPSCSASIRLPKPATVVRHADAPAYLIAGGKGLAQLYINEGTGANVAVSTLTFAPGAAVPEHAHDDSSETLYVMAGSAEMTIAGKVTRVGPGDVVHLPPRVKHSAKILGHVGSFKAVQVYVAPGAEQRFTKGERVTPEP
jgi:quercetin dioxygenase-like cupin family protein